MGWGQEIGKEGKAQEVRQVKGKTCVTRWRTFWHKATRVWRQQLLKGGVTLLDGSNLAPGNTPWLGGLGSSSCQPVSSEGPFTQRARAQLHTQLTGSGTRRRWVSGSEGMDLRGQRNRKSRLFEIFMLGTLQFTKLLGVSHDAWPSQEGLPRS